MTDSGTMARVESVTDSLERVLAKLDRLDDRVGDLRVDIVALRNAIDNVRSLVDGVHVRAAKIESEHAAVVARIAALETEAAEVRGAARANTAKALGAAAGGGGAVAALAEIIRTFVGMP